MSQQKKTRSQLKREAIITAAMAAFQQYGVQATSMDKLAEMAQVSKRTVYNHFESKEALVMYLIADLWNTAMVDLDIVYDAKQPLSTQMLQLVLAEIKLISESTYIEMARVAFGHFFYHPQALQQELDKLSKQESALLKWIKAATSDGKLSAQDAEFANSQLHNLIKGSCFWPQLMKMAEPLTQAQQDELAVQSVAMFLSHYQV